MRLVLDASVTLSWLFADARGAARDYADSILDAMTSADAAAEVPVTWALEVSNVLARGEARALISEAQSEAFLEMLSGIHIRPDGATFPHALAGTLQLARRHRLSAYDASYLELALRTGLPLASLDADLLKAARKAGVHRYSPST